MLRYILAGICVLALATPAFGYEVIWQGEPEGDIDISLQIDCYIQIDRQDSDILFSDGTTPGPHDWWMTSLQPVGTVQCPDDGGKTPMDPWAGDSYYAGAGGRFYESYDGATIFVRSNNDFNMQVHTNGDLFGQINDPNNKIPTWWTLCLCPFMMNGIWLTGHTPPLGGCNGCYTYDTGGGPPIPILAADASGNCTGPGHPGQHVYPCEPASTTYKLSIPAIAEGTMVFHARIERHGMQDPGDQYWTWLDVDFFAGL